MINMCYKNIFFFLQIPETESQLIENMMSGYLDAIRVFLFFSFTMLTWQKVAFYY